MNHNNNEAPVTEKYQRNYHRNAVPIDTHDWFRLVAAFEPALLQQMWDDAINGPSVRLLAQQQSQYEAKRVK